MVVNFLLGGGVRVAVSGRRCARCGGALSSYNTESLCSPCARGGQAALLVVPARVWESPQVREALADWDVGRLMRLLREMLQLSQSEIATRTGLSPSMLSYVEAGARRVSRIDQIMDVYDALDVPHHLLPTPRRRQRDTPRTGSAPQPSKAADVTPRNEVEQLSPGSVDPGLIFHWKELLQILSASHNSFGPHRIHTAATRELSVIRDHRLRADASIRRNLLTVEALWCEFASWTAENLGAEDAATHWLEHSLDLARVAGDHALEAYVLMRQSQHAAEHGHADNARDLAARACAITVASERDRALSALRLAHGHALSGDARACERALEEAHELVQRADEQGADDDPRTIGRHCLPAYLSANGGQCLLILGKAPEAAELLQQALATWPTHLRQDAQMARAWLAVAYAVDDRLPEATAEGTEVLNSIAAGGSVRVLRALRSLDRALPKGTRSPKEVADFRTALALTNPRI